ncbi:hypothetical protein PF004_g15689 [Phytophthora fragariae]|uniref:M96 mating-specific protein family n=1 Tax=Phytophthora fragariae TaxID=53985 RepID=A0A6A3MCP0_9STRA|nr:hypothetical protein PF011_g1156 [Phytophthora fragariae]KAE9212225.1 hypothetical protein PF004_g15689 [Phytophthora fragariae]
MAFLPDVDDDWAFDAALSFVDDYSLDALSPTSTPPIASSTSGLLWPSSELPHVKHEPMPAALNEGPTFTVACKEASAMVPISMKSLMSGSRSLSSGLQLSLPTADASPTKPKSTKAKKTPTNPNRVRDEAQYEVAYLREKVAELELQLRKLQLHATPSSTIDFLAAMSVQRPFAQVPRVWKEIATRQRRRRDEAQRENVRLRLMAERKRKMATGLSALLRKRLTQQGAECSRGKGQVCTERRTTSVLDFQGDIGDFHDLFQHLQSAYHEVDAVFAASGLASMEIPINDVHVREGVDGKYVEVFANKLLPFSLRDTGEAAWNHFKGVEKHFDNGGLYEKAAKNLDQPYTIIEDFTKEMFSNNSRADIKAKQIVQRIVGPDRDMILFVSSVTPIEIKHKPLDGLVYHAREYALTKRFSDSTPEHELSLLQLYVRISFDYDPGVVYDSRHVRSVVQFMIGNVGGSLRCYQERIENALIDQALRQN